MGVRTLRIPAIQIPSALPGLTGKWVHLTTRTGQNRSGTVAQADENRIILHGPNRNWFNRAHQTHIISVIDITEIILEQPSAW